MAKAGAPKKKAKPKLTDKEQSERFIETARELGVDESGKLFEEAFDEIASKASSSHPSPEQSGDHESPSTKK